MAITGTVQRGSIVWMRLHPQAGHEQFGYRAAIVLSDGIIDLTSSFYMHVITNVRSILALTCKQHRCSPYSCGRQAFGRIMGLQRRVSDVQVDTITVM